MNPGTTFDVTTAPNRASRHWAQSSITWGELVEMASNPSDRKACGNYVLGTFAESTVQHAPDEEPCTGLHRRKATVVSRSAITLDVDHPEPGFLANFTMVWPYAAIVHTTYNSTPDSPRYRLILPTDRSMAPDEYVSATKALMQQLGQDQFDQGSSEAERYMFRASAKVKSDYYHEVLDGEAAPVDEFLKDFEQDLSTKEMPLPHKNKRDPYTLPGVIGAFNTVYEDWDLLIEEFDLPYVKVDDNRYQLENAHSEAGMGPIAGVSGFVYSHHANDPAHGVTCSAFDLVRLHKFGDLDDGKENTPINRRPSYKEMMELASEDPRVARWAADQDFASPVTPPPLTDDDLGELLDDNNAWKIGIDRDKSLHAKDHIRNWDLFMENDPALILIRNNQLTNTPEATGDLPWRAVTRHSRPITEHDRMEFVDYMERTYGLRPSRMLMDSKIDIRAKRHEYNPVVDYLNGLTWDGVPRMEECLPGVTPTDSTRLIARKALVGAVARALDPGCKWDYTLMLSGPEGLGKSWWVDRMAKGFSATLGPIGHSDTILTMQRSWIVVSDEGHALRQADQDAKKDFLTRREDVIRRPYERAPLLLKRRCVIWSTTNEDTPLQQQEGNRRFLVVHCSSKVDFDRMTEEYVDQVWAEAVEAYRGEETTYFDGDQEQLMLEEREAFVEESPLEGIVNGYLEQKVPENWDRMGQFERQQWISDRRDGFVAEGTVTRDVVCSVQIWMEALGGRPDDRNRQSETMKIVNVLKKTPGWRKAKKRRWMGPYLDMQMVFVREGSDEDYD